MAPAAALPHLEPATIEFYRDALIQLQRAEVPFLVGGAYAFERYTGIERHTKDFDLFLMREDFERAAKVLSQAGYLTELNFPHWLGKAFRGDDFVDLIYSSGNGEAEVDSLWFSHAVDEIVFDTPVRLIPAEEMIWSKSFIMERERFDGADVAHVIQARGKTFDWNRLLQRFDDRWRVLLAHLILFGFIYPGELDTIPAEVLESLTIRLKDAPVQHPDKICRGTILSRQQYLVDVTERGYRDGRLQPGGGMSQKDIDYWTNSIGSER